MAPTIDTEKSWLNKLHSLPILLPSIAMLAVILLAYRMIINSPGFARDDAYHIYLSAHLDWYQFLYIPEIYQRISTAHLTPFSVAYYTLIQNVEAFSADTYFNCQLLVFGSWLIVFADFLRKHYAFQQKQLLTFIALSLSLGTTGTLLSRFYTEHYMFGGIFAVLALLSLSHYQITYRLRHFLTAILFMALAALAKEIFLFTYIICIILFWQDRTIKKQLMLIAPWLLIGYMSYRHFMLGTSIGGRGSDENIWRHLIEAAHAFPELAYFYASTHAPLLLLLAASLIYAPKRAIAGSFFALLLAVPCLAAPHVFLHPELHADRIFIASDLVLAATTTYCLFNRGEDGNPTISRRYCLSFWIIIAIGLIWSFYQAYIYDLNTSKSPDYKITSTILSSNIKPHSIYLPPNYANGSLIAAYSQILESPFQISANCLEALDWQPAGSMFFGADGSLIDRDSLAKLCQPLVQTKPPSGMVEFENGVLSWHIQAAEVLAAGVYFPAHALLIEARDFEERLVRPAPNERYSLFMRNGNTWWFSKEMSIVLPPSSFTASRTTLQ